MTNLNETLQSIESEFENSFADNDEYIGHVHRDTTVEDVKQFYSERIRKAVTEAIEATKLEKKFLYKKSVLSTSLPKITGENIQYNQAVADQQNKINSYLNE
jgi:hypothetical protein